MAAISQLFASFGLQTEAFTAGVRAIQRETKEIEKTIKPLTTLGKDVGKAMSLGITVPLVAIGTASVAAALKIDDAMDSIRAGTGATGAALEGLGADFRSVLGKVPDTIGDVSTAITTLAQRTGLAGPPLQELAEQSLNLARITGTNVGSAVVLATRVFGDWGIATDKQSSTLDFLFKVTQHTGIGLEKLSSSVVQFGAPLRQMGFDFETSAALLGKFEKEGVNAELVMGSLRIALTKMSKAGVTDAAEGLAEIQKQILGAGTAASATKIAVEAFGSKAGPDMAAAILEGRFEIGNLMKDLNASTDTINKVASDTAGFSEKLEVLKNKAALAAEPLGVALLDAFQTLTPAIEGALNILIDAAKLFADLPAPVKAFILVVAGIAAAAGPVLVAFAAVASSLVQLKLLFGGMTIVQTVAGYLGVAGVAGAALAAGAVVLGAAIGVVVGTFINWAVKALGLQTALDGLVKTVVEKIPFGIGQWITGTNKVIAATTETTAAQQKLIASLEAKGITVDKARLGDDKYLGVLAQQSLAMMKADGSLKLQTASTVSLTTATGAAAKAGTDAASSIDAVNKMLDGAGPKTNKVADAMKALKEQFTASLRPADDLNVELDRLGKLGFTTGQIVAVYGGKILAATAEQVKHGIAVTGTIATLQPLAQKIVNVEEAYDNLKKAQDDATESQKALNVVLKAGAVDLQTVEVSADGAKAAWNLAVGSLGGQKAVDAVNTIKKMGDETVKTRQAVEYLASKGYTASQIMEMLGADIKAAADHTRTFGGDLGNTTTKIIALDAATVKAAERAREMSQAFATAMANLTTRIAEGLADVIVNGGNFKDKMLGIAKDTAEGMLSSFLTGLIAPLTDAFHNMGEKIAGTLTDKVFSKIPGIGGGGESGGGLLGGVLGGGGGGGDWQGPIDSVGGGGGGGMGAATGGGSSAGMNYVKMAVDALGSIGVIFQLKRIEGTMNAVEANTRFTYIELADTMNLILHPMHNLVNWLAVRSNDVVDHLSEMLATLQHMDVSISGGAVTVIPDARSEEPGTVNQQITLTYGDINIVSPTGSTSDLIAKLKKALLDNQDDFAAAILRMIKNQSQGAVANG